ncbi:hypothetical protein AB7C87_23080 [Natrarchaeobius sp. A-rgal3]|uniref:hypothetical protein n=1 Tax=Natrarchaeobius versutus TaxID=1679078 RepID=UPI0035103EB0
MSIVKWLFSALLILQAHFAASYLVPLDREAQREFGGLLKWVWPWSDGDSGLLGQLTVSSDLPLLGLFLAIIAATLFFCAALAVVEIWVPFGWWRILAGGGAILSLGLMMGFFGATKVLPIGLNVVVLWAAVTGWLQPPG